MKTLLYGVLVATIVLIGCLLLNLIQPKRTKKDQRITLLILPVCMLLLFVGLFVGASISRNQLRKELVEMHENQTKQDNDARLTMLEKRYNNLSLIIGRDSETEDLMKEIEEATSLH